MRRIILASLSKNREKILKALNIPFKVISSNFDETKIKKINPKIRVRKLAETKGREVLKKT